MRRNLWEELEDYLKGQNKRGFVGDENAESGKDQIDVEFLKGKGDYST